MVMSSTLSGEPSAPTKLAIVGSLQLAFVVALAAATLTFGTLVRLLYWLLG
jgi:hypothetical protein